MKQRTASAFAFEKFIFIVGCSKSTRRFGKLDLFLKRHAGFDIVRKNMERI
jgi:hypothetical protein